MDKMKFFSKKSGKVVEAKSISSAKSDAYGVIMSGWSNGAWSKESGWVRMPNCK